MWLISILSLEIPRDITVPTSKHHRETAQSIPRTARARKPFQPVTMSDNFIFITLLLRQRSRTINLVVSIPRFLAPLTGWNLPSDLGPHHCEPDGPMSGLACTCVRATYADWMLSNAFHDNFLLNRYLLIMGFRDLFRSNPKPNNSHLHQTPNVQTSTRFHKTPYTDPIRCGVYRQLSVHSAYSKQYGQTAFHFHQNFASLDAGAAVGCEICRFCRQALLYQCSKVHEMVNLW